MDRKKVILVIVEGPTDETALSIILNKIFDQNKVHIYVVRGDITSEYTNSSQNILSKINNIINYCIENEHFRKTDFKEIIHIVDTDGAFIEDKNIVFDSKHKDPEYLDEKIITNNVESIIERNKRKSQILYKLITCGIVRSIPYRVYYMSCNLDHVLHNKRNSDSFTKENDAYDFAIKYKNNINDFIKFMCESEFSIIDNYNESWKFIEKENNSLNRYSNFGICLIKDVENK